MHALICSLKRERYIMLKKMLQSQGFATISFAEDTGEAEAALSQGRCQLCVIDLPFTMDQQELSYLRKLHKQYPALLLIVLCSSKAYDTVSEKLSGFGIFVAMKPLLQSVFLQLISFVKAALVHYQSYEQGQKELLDKISEIKLVDRAKCILMEQEYCSEAIAHRMIEKQAMDQRMTRCDIAKQILQDYEE